MSLKFSAYQLEILEELGIEEFAKYGITRRILKRLSKQMGFDFWVRAKRAFATFSFQHVRFDYEFWNFYNLYIRRVPFRPVHSFLLKLALFMHGQRAWTSYVHDTAGNVINLISQKMQAIPASCFRFYSTAIWSENGYLCRGFRSFRREVRCSEHSTMNSLRRIEWWRASPFSKHRSMVTPERLDGAEIWRIACRASGASRFDAFVER